MQKLDQGLRRQSLACTLRAFAFELGQEGKSVLHGGLCDRQAVPAQKPVSVLSINLKGQPSFIQLSRFQERRKVTNRGQCIQRSLAARACVYFPSQLCVNNPRA